MADDDEDPAVQLRDAAMLLHARIGDLVAALDEHSASMSMLTTALDKNSEAHDR